MSAGTSAAEPPHYPESRPRAATIRSRLMLEVASELVGLDPWRHKQARVDLREQGAHEWSLGLLGSDGIDAVAEMAAGRAQFAILNPAAAITAVASRLPEGRDLELRAIATIPSYDQLGLAIPASLGIETLEQLAQTRPVLALSLRGSRPNHAVHLVVEDTLAAAGLALSDLRDWGGVVTYDDGLPHQGRRREALANGETTAVFDEGVYNWVELAVTSGLSFLSVGEQTLASLARVGYRPGRLTKERNPTLPADVVTVDFSGFLIFTHAGVGDDTVTAFCEAMDARRDRIPWQGGTALPLERMCSDAVDAPLPIPLHPAAERYWRERGYPVGDG